MSAYGTYWKGCAEAETLSSGFGMSNNVYGGNSELKLDLEFLPKFWHT
jgi:hypothetical protein